MSIKRTIKFLIISLALCFVGIFFSANQAQALSDSNGRLSNLSVDGVTDNVSPNVTFVKIEEGRTVTVAWTVSAYPSGYDYFSIRYACGSSASAVTTYTNTIATIGASSSRKSYSTSWTIPAYYDYSKYCKIWIVAKSNSSSEPLWAPNSGVIEITQKAKTLNPTVNTISVYPTTIDLGSTITFTGYGKDVSGNTKFYIVGKSMSVNGSPSTITASSNGSYFYANPTISSSNFSAGSRYCVRADVGGYSAPSSEDKCFTINFENNINSVDTSGYSCVSGKTYCEPVSSNAQYKTSSWGNEAKTTCEANTSCHAVVEDTSGYSCISGTACSPVSSNATYKTSVYGSGTKATCEAKTTCHSSGTTVSTAGYNCSNGSCGYVSSGATYLLSSYDNDITKAYNACNNSCSSTPIQTISTWGYDCISNECKYSGSNATYRAYQSNLGKEDWAIAYSNCSTGCKSTVTTPVCGNGTCESGENASSCRTDCGYCGDGTCYGTETTSNCSYDCKTTQTTYCGDGICNGVETTSNCSQDCKSTVTTPVCGNGTCESGENASSCRTDCGYCGDGTCYGTETTSNCSYDCKTTQTEILSGVIGAKSYLNGTLTAKGTWTSGTAYNAHFAVYPTAGGEGKASALLSNISKNQEFSRTITDLSSNTSYSLILYLNGTEVKREIYTTSDSATTQEALAGVINSYSYAGGVLTIKGTWTSGNASNASFAVYPTAGGEGKVSQTIFNIIKNQETTGAISGLADNTNYELQFRLNGTLVAKQKIDTTINTVMSDTSTSVGAKITNATYDPNTQKAAIKIQTTGFKTGYSARAFYRIKGTVNEKTATIPSQNGGATLVDSFVLPNSYNSTPFEVGKTYEIYYKVYDTGNKVLATSNIVEFNVTTPEKLTAPNVTIENIYDNSSDKTVELAFNDKKALTDKSTKSLVYAKAYVKHFEGGIQYETYVKIKNLADNTEVAPALVDSGVVSIYQESGTTNWIGRVLSKYSPNNYFGKEYCYFVRAKKKSSNEKIDSDWAQSQEFCVIGTPWVITDDSVYSQDGKTVALKGRITSFGKYSTLDAYFKMYAKGYEPNSVKKPWQSNPAKKPATVAFSESINPYAYGSSLVPDDAWNNFCYKACVTRSDNSNELCGQEKCFERKATTTAQSVEYFKILSGSVVDKLNSSYPLITYSWPIDTLNTNVAADYWYTMYKKDASGQQTDSREIQKARTLFGSSSNATNKMQISLYPGADKKALIDKTISYCVTPYAQIVNSTNKVNGSEICYPENLATLTSDKSTFNFPNDCNTETLDPVDVVDGNSALKATLRGRINNCFSGMEDEISRVEGTFMIYKDGVATGKESDPILISNNAFDGSYNISNASGGSYSYEAKAYAYDKAGNKYPFLTGVRKAIKATPPQPKQSVKLISPNGGETFTIGDTISVKLEKGIATDKVYLFLQDDKTTSPKNIKINTEAIVGNEYSFVLTKELVTKITNQIAGSKYKMDAVIYANNNPYTVAVNDATDGYFSIKDSGSSDTDTQQKIKLISPNGGETFTVDDTIVLTWENKQPFTQVHITLRDYETAQKYVTNITSSGVTYGKNTYSFKITSDILKRFAKIVEGGHQYKFEAYLYDTQQNNKMIGMDDSDDYFSIVSKPIEEITKEATLSITSPIVGDKIKVGDNLNIKWTGKNLPADGKVILLISDDRTDYNKLIATDAPLSKGNYSLKIDNTLVDFFENQQGKTYDINNSAFKILAIATKADWSYINAGKPLKAESGEFNIVKSSTSTVAGFDITTPVDGDVIKIGEDVVTKWTSNSLPQGAYLSLIFRTKDGKMSAILANKVDLASGINTFSTNKLWAESYETKYGNIENADFYIYGAVRDASGNIFYQDNSGYFKIKKAEQSDDNQTEPEDDQSEEKGCSVIQISTATCLPCQKMKPISAKVAQLFGTTLDETVNNQTAYTSKIVNNIDGVKFFYIDVSAFRPSDRTSLVAKYFPQGDGNFVPQILIYKNGKDVVLARGTTDETEYKNLVNKYCGTSIYNEDDNQTEPEDDQVKPEEDIKGLSIKTLKPTTDSSKTLLQAQILEMPAGKSMQVEWISRPKDGEYGTDPLRWTLVDANYNVKQVFTKGAVALQMSGVSFIIDNQLSNYCFTAVGIVDGKEEKATNEECFK